YILAPEIGRRIDEAQDATVPSRPDRAQQRNALLAGPIDQRRRQMSLGADIDERDAAAFEHQLDDEAEEQDRGGAEDRVDDNGRSWNGVLAEHEERERPEKNRQPDGGQD